MDLPGTGRQVHSIRKPRDRAGIGLRLRYDPALVVVEVRSNMRSGLRLVIPVCLLLSGGHAGARELAPDEKRIIETALGDFLQTEPVRITWNPFTESLAQNPIERRIYCAAVEADGKDLPFMVRVTEEINYHIRAVTTEYVYHRKPKDFTEKLNNSATLEYCGEAGYPVRAP